MIKNEQTLALSVNTTNIKATVAAESESDEILFPYCVGYIPWSMIDESMMFNWTKYHYTANTSANPNIGLFTPAENTFDKYPSLKATKGIPFCWALSDNNSNNVQELYKYNGTTFERAVQPFTEYSKTSSETSNKKIITTLSYKNMVSGSHVSNFADTFKVAFYSAYYTITDGKFDDRYTGYRVGYGTYNPITDTLSSFNFNAFFGRNYDLVEITIDDNVFKSITKNNPHVLDVTTTSGTQGKVITYIIGYYCDGRLGNYYSTGYTIGQFLRNTNVLGATRISSPFSGGSIGFKMYGSGRTSLVSYAHDYGGLYEGDSYILSDDEIDIDFTNYPEDELTEDLPTMIYQAYTDLGFIKSTLTATDIKILSLISSPIIYDADTNKCYTQEYNDNYELTGNWIEVYKAPDLNPDTNTFNPDDIPEPTPPEPGDSDTLGEDITGFDFTLTPLSAANNFTTLYALTTGQLAAFGRTLWAKLWSDDFWKSVGTTFLNDFSINPADMMRYFINLHYFPFDLSVYPWASTDGVYVGRAVEPIAVETRVFSRNLIQIDGGVCAVPAYYNDFRDYEPCTNVEITIPFCGNVQIAPSECIGKVLSLTYTVDMQTGAITALVYVNSDKKYIVAQLSGQCAATIPITADNNLEFVGRIAKVTGATLFEGIKSGAEMFKESESVKGAIGIGAAVGIASGAAAVTGLPPVSVHKMGESGGFANYGGAYRAYITITRQKYSVPANYGATVGYAADFTATVGSLSGLFACQNVDTSGLTCNYDERAEIKRLLESGCYM